MTKVRALVVDDSALMRRLLTDILQADPNIEVVGVAQDAYVAREKIKALDPDVITLDVEMPKMDGLCFLKNLMRLRPMPVVMISSLTEQGADVALQALDLGAVDFVTKPKVDLAHSMEHCANEIRSKVKTAARVPVHLLSGIARNVDKKAPTAVAANETLKEPVAQRRAISQTLIAIGASTGGTEAIKDVLTGLPGDCPGVVITQHIPPEFSRSFAERMDKCSSLSVCEAEDGQTIYDGHAYIAPGGRHLEIVRKNSSYVCRVFDGERVNRHRPSVDVLFDSVAIHAGAAAVGIILTGMGRDGALGMRRMHDAGAINLAQDEQSSVVWGMPGAAIQENAVDAVYPLDRIAAECLKLVS